MCIIYELFITSYRCRDYNWRTNTISLQSCFIFFTFQMTPEQRQNICRCLDTYETINIQWVRESGEYVTQHWWFSGVVRFEKLRRFRRNLCSLKRSISGCGKWMTPSVTHDARRHQLLRGGARGVLMKYTLANSQLYRCQDTK